MYACDFSEDVSCGNGIKWCAFEGLVSEDDWIDFCVVSPTGMKDISPRHFLKLLLTNLHSSLSMYVSERPFEYVTWNFRNLE